MRVASSFGSLRPGVTGRFAFHTSVYWLHAWERSRKIRRFPQGFSDFHGAYVSSYARLKRLFVHLGGRDSELKNTLRQVYTADAAYSLIQRMALRAELDGKTGLASYIRGNLDEIELQTSLKVIKLASKYGIAVPSSHDDPNPLDWKRRYTGLFGLGESQQALDDGGFRKDIAACKRRIYTTANALYRALGGLLSDLPPKEAESTRAEQYYDALQKMSNDAESSGEKLRSLSIGRCLVEFEEKVHSEVQWLVEKHGIDDTEVAQAPLQYRVGGVPGTVVLPVARPGSLKYATGVPVSLPLAAEFEVGVTMQLNPAAESPLYRLDLVPGSNVAAADATFVYE